MEVTHMGWLPTRAGTTPPNLDPGSFLLVQRRELHLKRSPYDPCICTPQLFKMFLGAFILLALHLRITVSTSVRRSSPTVILDDATFTGTGDGQVSQFLGIPYVQPP